MPKISSPQSDSQGGHCVALKEQGAHNQLLFFQEKPQRGLSEAQNGYGFGMLPGYGRRERAFSSLALDGSPASKLFIA